MTDAPNFPESLKRGEADAPRVAVAIPARDMVHAGFAYDLAALVAHHSAAGDVELVVLVSQGTLLVHQRAQLCEDALADGCTHVLFLDSDMRFPPDTLARLLAHGLPVVAANGVRRRAPILPTAWTADDAAPVLVWTHPDADGLEAVGRVGMAVMLLSARVLEAVPRPWFETPWTATGYRGEDTDFCLKVRGAGFGIWVDHRLSLEVGHLGEREYTPADSWPVRAHFARKAS